MQAPSPPTLVRTIYYDICNLIKLTIAVFPPGAHGLRRSGTAVWEKGPRGGAAGRPGRGDPPPPAGAAIGRCRAVCKAWLSRTSQLDFLRAHAARSCPATVTAAATVETRSRTTTPRGRSCTSVRIRRLGRKCSGAVASLAVSFVSASE